MLSFEKQIQFRQAEQNAALGKLAAQVAHDIRSPLAALEVAVRILDGLTDDERILIKGASSRIKDIANNLLHQNKSVIAAEQMKPELMASLVERLVSEKRLSLLSNEDIRLESVISDNASSSFALIKSTELLRVLSNLINNSVEALEGRIGLVTIELQRQDSWLQLSVRDNGPGVSNETLSKLMSRGATFHKTSGSGLGLYHAKRTVEELGGSISILSSEGIGFEVKLLLPDCAPPAFFLQSIELLKGQRVVIVDDDPSIHSIWKQKLKPDSVYEILHSPEELKVWLGKRPESDITRFKYLIDFEFRASDQNGLDVISDLRIAEDSVLVTSHFDEPDIQRQCLNMGIKMVPKSHVGTLAIEYS
jgi:two-component sensor histidine kinase